MKWTDQHVRAPAFWQSLPVTVTSSSGTWTCQYGELSSWLQNPGAGRRNSNLGPLGKFTLKDEGKAPRPSCQRGGDSLIRAPWSRELTTSQSPGGSGLRRDGFHLPTKRILQRGPICQIWTPDPLDHAGGRCPPDGTGRTKGNEARYHLSFHSPAIVEFNHDLLVNANDESR